MHYRMVLHDGVVSEDHLTQLCEAIRRIHADVFAIDGSAVDFDITVVPSGRFFTAAKLSSTSLVGTSVPAGTSVADRTRLMSEISAAWCEVTGCTPDEIVVSASD